jgi:DNA-binding transcriptional LysR family regulator
MTEPDWTLYRSFLAVLREGSLSAAARAIGATQPTLGRHIQQLEQALGCPLFTRAPGGLTPTPVALTLRPHAEAMETAAEALRRQASGESLAVRGTIRISASEMVGGVVLPPMLARFQSDYPEIAFELSLSNSQDDLLRREADIAIRMVRPTQDALLARSVGTITIGFYAHRRYVERHGLPADFAALAGHIVIGYDKDTTVTRGLSLGGLPITPDLFRYRVDNDLAQWQALLAGAGIGGCQDRLAAREPDLVAVLPDKMRFQFCVWLVMHEDQRDNRRIKLLFDFLAEEMRAYIAGEDSA